MSEKAIKAVFNGAPMLTDNGGTGKALTEKGSSWSRESCQKKVTGFMQDTRSCQQGEEGEEG